MVGPGAKPGVHALGIKNPRLFHHIPALDARGFLNEFDAGRWNRLADPGGNGGRMLVVVPFGKLVEGGDQLLIADRLGWGVQASSADGDTVHKCESRC